MLKVYSDPKCPHCHAVRFVVEEKELPAQIVEVDPNDPPEDFLRLNPTAELPAIYDADHLLIDAAIIVEYLDERYPHPALKPGSPIERAFMRLAIRRIERELYPRFERIPKARRKGEAREEMRELLRSFDAHFARSTWLVGEEFSLADVRFAPMLFRLPFIGVRIDDMPHLRAYRDRLFERPAFERSLSEAERMMRER